MNSVSMSRAFTSSSSAWRSRDERMPYPLPARSVALLREAGTEAGAQAGAGGEAPGRAEESPPGPSR
jgi:hypothetical protein